ncbi:EAL domain-containing response regulator [Propionivibrio sp.]|uniref:EAL domain-containing response regulator n=1 Tax=Propionivibrio sp. TaxID=2212460 RepID=UPI003BF3B39E
MNNKFAIRILVLDDEPFMLKLLCRMLENSGFSSVSTCDNGRAALELLDRTNCHPDLILLDINMPEMDGVEFVRHLVEHHYSGALILVSGEDERVLQSVEKLVRAHKISVLGYLTKPVIPARLAELIDKWMPPAQVAIEAAKRIYSAEELGEAMVSGELVNYYQPKVDVATGEVVGVETLVRWRHPSDGMVYPDKFITLAEEHGLIDELTRVVLSGALNQSRTWRDAGMPLRVAVNVSMDNLVSLNFLNNVVELTSKAGVPPQEVVLEVTESRLMTDLRVPLEILTRLHLKRFRLSIDDFGTGNSSLTQLRNIPFVELKIDQSFVHGAWANDTQRAMFNASHGLATQLKMESVAEGVEDRADWDFVRHQGCDLAQGYFIARPMPAEDLPAWLVDWKRRCPELVLQ